jgi:hypothetical protein
MVASGAIRPDVDPASQPQIEARICELLRKMTLEQKVAQMLQADIRWVTPDDVRRYRLGSILNGGGAFPNSEKHSTVADWVSLADRFYDASMDTSADAPAIPILWGTDGVHGHNNVIGATLFPHNVGLGAAQLPAAGGTAVLNQEGNYQAKPDVAIVVFGEHPYAEWHGDPKSFEYLGPSDDGHEVDIQRPAPEVNELAPPNQPAASATNQESHTPNADLALPHRLRQSDIPVVAVFLTGRVRGVTPELEASNAFVVAWLPGSQGGGIADVLFRKNNGAVSFPFTGKLSYTWPRTGSTRPNATTLFTNGYGLGGCVRH